MPIEEKSGTSFLSIHRGWFCIWPRRNGERHKNIFCPCWRSFSKCLAGRETGIGLAVTCLFFDVPGCAWERLCLDPSVCPVLWLRGCFGMANHGHERSIFGPCDRWHSVSERATTLLVTRSGHLCAGSQAVAQLWRSSFRDR